MKTIVVHNCGIRKAKQIKRILLEMLISDPFWHAFYWNDKTYGQSMKLIVRISEKGLVAKFERYLKKQKLEFEEYAFPTPRNGQFFAENKKHIKHLFLFLQLYHAHTVASIVMNKREWDSYLNRAIHTAFNTRGYSYNKEAKEMIGHGISYLVAPIIRGNVFEILADFVEK